MKPITLTVYRREEPKEDLFGRVRIDPRAEMIVRELQRESGLSLKHIVSEIIVQAAEYVEIKEV